MQIVQVILIIYTGEFTLHDVSVTVDNSHAILYHFGCTIPLLLFGIKVVKSVGMIQGPLVPLIHALKPEISYRGI
jgi:hypothetical protein